MDEVDRLEGIGVWRSNACFARQHVGHPVANDPLYLEAGKEETEEAMQSSAQISSSLTPSLEGAAAAAEAEAAAASVATASPPTKRPRTDLNYVQTPPFEMDPSLNLEERW